MTLKCAVYVRVSTENVEQQTSIQSQILLFDNFIQEKGWELYHIYQDIESGTKSNRSGVQSLIKDAKDRKFDIVLSKEFSRISRNGAFSYEFKNVLLENRIDFMTLDGAINTLENNSMNFGLFAWMSEMEAERTSQRIKISYKARAKAGLADDAPYGYDLRDGKLFISDDGSAEIVKRIYAKYIEGKSFDAIARELYNENIITPAQRKGKKNAGVFWHGSTVRQILEREIYTGCLIACKTSIISPITSKRIINKPEDWIVTENTHEPIISKEDFDLVQQLISARKRIRSQQQKHLFIGFLSCSNCGASMQFKRDRYVCGYQNKHGKKACSCNFRPKEQSLKQLILDDINNLYFSKLHEDSFNTFINKHLQKKFEQNDSEFETKSLTDKLNHLNNKKQKALHMLLDEKIQQNDFDAVVSDINLRIEEINNKLDEIRQNEINSSGTIEEVEAYVRSQINLKEPLTELTPTILARFIHKIVVKPDGQLEVHYRTSNPSVFYVSTNIKLDIPKNHPNKAYVEKHA